MMRIVFRMPKTSRITNRDSWKDIGHSSVQARKESESGMEVVNTLNEQPLGLFTQHTDRSLLKAIIWILTPSQNETCR